MKMRITKKRLQQLIQSELAQVILEREEMEEAPEEAAPSGVGDLASSAAGKKQQSDVAKVLTYINKIDNKIELSQVITALVDHAPTVQGSREILRKLYKALPAMVKQAQ